VVLISNSAPGPIPTRWQAKLGDKVLGSGGKRGTVRPVLAPHVQAPTVTGKRVAALTADRPRSPVILSSLRVWRAA